MNSFTKYLAMVLSGSVRDDRQTRFSLDLAPHPIWEMTRRHEKYIRNYESTCGAQADHWNRITIYVHEQTFSATDHE